MEISENSRIWIYQSDRQFSQEEQTNIQALLEEFTGQWAAHGHKLTTKAEIRYSRFIILMVDEAQTGTSGCSIDKSVGLMRQIEESYGVNLFDRFNIAYKKGDAVLSCNRTEFETLLQNGEVNEDTLVFNNLVPTLKDLKTNWEVPLRDSWHAQVFAAS